MSWEDYKRINDQPKTDMNASSDYFSESPTYGSDDKSSNPGCIDNDPYCNGCQRQFVNMVALNQHLFHSLRHHWCFECSRDFRSQNALIQHQDSLAHRGRDFKCPFCLGMFKSPSGVALHIESGCHNVSRHHVTAAVQAMNIVPNISTKRITGPAYSPTVAPLHRF
ncbi:hypothetical protein M413DRAFT_11099 [Hebeloma cylindrosporum]|uniref:C2H2-type domain-containing protein n=1 Tax=Hebeloma cylindrosporum TaxID=76867 RepID=A0A0C2XV95_HEBCY|nr:hypothetical protein M413DRAFT_11099 [Hebeloma cylindrosporum h7]